MFKRLLSSLFCLSVFLFLGCSDTSQRGSLTVQADLRISNIEIEGVTPSFSPDNFGTYEVSVEGDVESVSLTLGELFAESPVEIVIFRIASVVDGARPESFEQSALAGDTVAVPVGLGLNGITVSIRTDGAQQVLNYTFTVLRAGFDANLTAIDIRDDGRIINESVGLPLPQDFDPSTTDYTLDIPYSSCTTNLRATAVSGTELRLNGEIIISGSDRQIDLPVGRSESVLTVQSEDGTATTTYNLVFNREQPTAEERDADFTLSNLSLAQGGIRNTTTGAGFNCNSLVYTARLSSSEATASISAAPTIADRQVQIGRQVVETTDDGTEQTSIVDLVTVTAGVATDFDLEPGLNVFIVSTRQDENGDPVVGYQLIINRSEGNTVIVGTAEELQEALLAAQPNDEIVILSESREPLLGSASEALSGKEGTVFYSSASGTKAEPITLINESFLVFAALDEAETDIMFELAGDYWQIQNIQIEGGATGMLLNDASHNVIDTVRINDSGSTAVQLLNGSNNNALASFSITNSGGRGLVVGSDASSWTTAPVAGEYAPLNQNNQFGRVTLGNGIAGAHVHVEEGAENTVFRSIQVDAFDVDNATTALVEIQGNNTEFSFSELKAQNASGLDTVFSVSDAGYEWLTEAWGEDSQITDVRFDLPSQAAIPLVSAGDDVDSVFVANNERSDDVAVSYSGAAIDQNFIRPFYQIQWIDWSNVDADETNIAENTYCIQRAPVAHSLLVGETPLTRSLLGAVPATCDIADEDQHWNVSHDGDGFVLITDPLGDAIAGPTYQRTVIASRNDGVTLFNASAVGETNAFFLRWAFSAEERGEFAFESKLQSSIVMTFDLLDVIIYQINGMTGLPSQLGSFTAEDADSLVLSAQTRSEDIQTGFTLIPLP